MPEEVKNVVIEPTDPNSSMEDKDVELFGGEEETQIDTSKPKEVKELPKEEEEKEEEPEEEQEELEQLAGFDRPTFKEMSAKYPNIFKDFPNLRNVIAREHEFNELFPEGIENAREAVDNQKDFNFFSEKVTSGDAKTFLEVVKDAGKADLGNFVTNFLPALRSVDNDLYVEATAPLFVGILQSMYSDAERAGNENLKHVALYASKYIFNDHRYATGEVKLKEREVKEKDVKDDEITKERQSLNAERYQDAYSKITDEVDDALTTFVEENIPEEFSGYLRESLVERIVKEADKLISRDQIHMKNMTRLWQLSERSNYDLPTRQRIITAAMNKYKSVIPEIRRKHIARAKGKEERTEHREEITGSSRSSGKKRQVTTSRNIDYSKTSDEDLFSGNVTYRN